MDFEPNTNSIANCNKCKNNINGSIGCKAFPKGIPPEVWAGENDHTKPIDGDNGIQFEPIEEFEKHLPGKHDQKTHGRGGGGKQPKLTNDEVADIEFYTGTGYAGWNKALRADPNSATYKQAVEDSAMLDSALKKLPASPGTSYRNMKVDADSPEFQSFVKSHQKGSIVTYRAYTSTSGISDIASFGGKGDTAINVKINGKNGRDISKYSKGLDEQEILFGRDSKFIIKNVKKTKNGYEIEMDEAA